MAHVGNGHAQQPAAAGAGRHLHGVVKVAGVRAVNGDQGQAAQVFTPFQILRCGAARQGGGLVQGGGRKVPRGLMVDLDQGLLHVHGVFLSIIAQKSRGPEVGGERLQRGQQNQGARGGGGGVRRQLHAEFYRQAGVGRTAEQTAARAPAHVGGHFLQAAFQHFQHAPRAPARVAGGERRAHRILMPGPGCGFGGDVNFRRRTAVGRVALRADQAAAVTQGAEAANHGAQALGLRPEAAGQADQPALVGQVFQQVKQIFFGATGQAQHAQQIVQAHGPGLGSKGLLQLCGVGQGCRKTAVGGVFFHVLSVGARNGGKRPGLSPPQQNS